MVKSAAALEPRPEPGCSRDPQALLEQLTLEEKAALLTGDSAWTTAPIPRLGIPAIRVADGPHGVRRTGRSDSMAYAASAATCFPTASCTSATWDPDAIMEMSAAIGREAIALGVDIVLGPGANMKRSPLCGRNFEYFSEDPLLAGRLASAWIDGIQATGVGASLKHFAVNNQETRRMSVSADLDERALRELYLAAFEGAVTATQPWTVMCSYNRVNGTYASQHAGLLTDILRDEWGYEGVVVSDWAAVHDRPRALAAGLDLEMPGPRPRRVKAVVDAVRSGALQEAAVDASVLRMLRLIERASRTPKGGSFDAAAHHALARRIAGQGMVLLKNDGLLPLSPEGRIAVIGRAARDPRIQGGGSSRTTPTAIDEPFAELERLAGNARLGYAAGYEPDGSGTQQLVDEAVELARVSDVAVVFVALPAEKESEGSDRTDIDLTSHQVRLIRAVAGAQPRCAIVLFSGSAVSVQPWITEVGALLEAWYAGQAAGGAIADILFGVVNPSGRLAETFPVRIEDTPAYLNFPGEGDAVRYGEGVFIGYRWYEARRMQVAFPFGHGLSYTSFAYGSPGLSTESIEGGEPVAVNVEVTNTGRRSGTEVVQVYVRDLKASVPRPEKELAGFARVAVDPDETRSVRIELGPEAFRFWDPRVGRWVIEPGSFEIAIGASSADIRAVLALEITVSDALPRQPGPMSPLEDWIASPTTRARTIDLLGELAPVLGETFGAAAANVEGLDPHFHSFFGTMPLRDLLEFAAPAGGPDPDLKLAELLDGIGVSYAASS